MKMNKWVLGLAGTALFSCAVFFCLLHCEGNSEITHFLKRADARISLPWMVGKPTSVMAITDCKQLVSNPDFWIAHGGGLGDFLYTNSREAVLDSLQRGYKYIELDILVTSDGHLVGGHDWPLVRDIAGLTDVQNCPLSRAELLACRSSWKYTLLFAEDICRLMEENPQMILVTDKVQDFDLLVREIPYVDRIVVEAFDSYNYLAALRAGVKNVALTVYSDQNLIQAHKYKLHGLVMYAHELEKNPKIVELATQLHQEGCCIMVHGAPTCDDVEFIRKYLGRCVSRIYTNAWSPQDPPPDLLLTE